MDPLSGGTTAFTPWKKSKNAFLYFSLSPSPSLQLLRSLPSSYPHNLLRTMLFTPSFPRQKGWSFPSPEPHAESGFSCLIISLKRINPSRTILLNKMTSPTIKEIIQNTNMQTVVKSFDSGFKFCSFFLYFTNFLKWIYMLIL